MGYTPSTINYGDLIDPAWGNKIEQEIARRGSFMGIVASKDELPATPETGDWYVSLEGRIYLWDGARWRILGGGEMSEQRFVDMTEMFVEPETYTITGDGSTTTFSAPADAIFLKATTSYTYTISADGSTITFDTAPADGEIIETQIGRWTPVKVLEIFTTSEDVRSTVFVGWDMWTDTGLKGQGRVKLDGNVSDVKEVTATADVGFGVEFDKNSLEIGNHNIVLELRPAAPDTIVYTRAFEARW